MPPLEKGSGKNRQGWSGGSGTTSWARREKRAAKHWDSLEKEEEVQSGWKPDTVDSVRKHKEALEKAAARAARRLEELEREEREAAESLEKANQAKKEAQAAKKKARRRSRSKSQAKVAQEEPSQEGRGRQQEPLEKGQGRSSSRASSQGKLGPRTAVPWSPAVQAEAERRLALARERLRAATGQAVPDPEPLEKGGPAGSSTDPPLAKGKGSAQSSLGSTSKAAAKKARAAVVLEEEPAKEEQEEEEEEEEEPLEKGEARREHLVLVDWRALAKDGYVTSMAAQKLRLLQRHCFVRLAFFSRTDDEAARLREMVKDLEKSLDMPVDYSHVLWKKTGDFGFCHLACEVGASFVIDHDTDRCKECQWWGLHTYWLKHERTWSLGKGISNCWDFEDAADRLLKHLDRYEC